MTFRSSVSILTLVALTAFLSACDAKPTPDPAATKPSATATTTVTTTASATATVSTPVAVAAPTVTAPPMPSAPEDVSAAPADATKTKTGLASKVITKGTGKDHPGEYDKVSVHYTGWTKDGKAFDSSITRGKPTEFPLNSVIPGWTEGVQLMVVGEKRRFWIPSKIAYGDKAAMMGAPAGDLTFDIELLEIKKGPKPPPVPEDVKAAPASAKKTKSGIAYRVLQAGKGTEHPTGTSRVTVHYSGWTPNGKMFDSSVVRGEPTKFGLNGVIKGWTEGVQLMVEGEKTRFWIPGPLAYGEGSQDEMPPKGMLVFDIELISIQK
jgi:FKBP-type peptidyl-prolyl cis-trans isomerase